MAENPVIPPDESLARGWSAPLMPRKIVQCAEIHGTLTVLCNDGTLWALVKGGKWIQPWPPIPQEAAPDLLARARLAERMAEATRCHGTKNGKHEWRAGEYDDARENSWCCRCARTAMDILDATHAVLREWDAMEKGDGDAEAKPRSDRMG